MSCYQAKNYETNCVFPIPVCLVQKCLCVEVNVVIMSVSTKGILAPVCRFIAFRSHVVFGLQYLVLECTLALLFFFVLIKPVPSKERQGISTGRLLFRKLNAVLTAKISYCLTGTTAQIAVFFFMAHKLFPILAFYWQSRNFPLSSGGVPPQKKRSVYGVESRRKGEIDGNVKK